MSVEVDFRQTFGASDQQGWETDYLANVQEREPFAVEPLALELDRDDGVSPELNSRAPALALGGGDDGYSWYGEENLLYDDDYYGWE
jgi:hypothetical protein